MKNISSRDLKIFQDFQANSTAGLIKFGEIINKNIVLYFYPKDNTPGCSIQAKEFSSLYEDFLKLDTFIYGISRDSITNHEKFILKLSIKHPLISDDKGDLCRLFRVLQAKSAFGKQYTGISRTTFLIGKDKLIKKAWYKVSPKGHAADVMECIASLNNNIL